MNGKAAKRIHHAARIISRPTSFRKVVKRLKREYKALPYHRRAKQGIVIEPHSAVLRRMQEAPHV